MPDPTLEQRLRDVARQLDDASRSRVEPAGAYARPIRSTTTRSSGDRRPAFLAAAAVLVVVAVMGVLAIVEDQAHVTVPAPRPVDPDLVVLVADGWTIPRHDESRSANLLALEYESMYLSPAGNAGLHRRVHGYNDKFAEGAAQTEVFGLPVHLIVSDDYVRAFWRTERFDFELRGTAGTSDAFLALLGALRQVDDAGYRAVIDPVTEPPEERSALVDEMLRGVPLPPGFSTDALVDAPLAQQRYVVGAQVMSAVACGWIESWIAAKTANDDAGVQRAADALASSHEWPTLLEMQDQAVGPFPSGLWNLADAVAKGTPINGGRPGLTVEETAPGSLGCGR